MEFIMILDSISAIQSGNWREAIIEIILTLPVIMFALAWHEAAHGYMAYKMGDPTARNLGRLTLNPAKHIDHMGFIAMMILCFGWAKPVPISARLFDNPKRGMALTAIAGPIANFISGCLGAALYGICFVWNYKLAVSPSVPELLYNVSNVLCMFFALWALYNFVFMVFNLIPLPPFDGSRFFLQFLPADKYFRIMQYEKYILIGVFVALWGSSYMFNFSPFSWVANKLLYTVASPFVNIGTKIFF